MLTIKLGNYNLWITTETFWVGNEPEYFECKLSLTKDNGTYYCHLHKEEKFSVIDFKCPPDEKKLSLEDFQIKTVEFNSFQHRKDCNQPMWKLHRSTLEKLMKELSC